MQEKVQTFVPGKYDPIRNRILVRSSGNIFNHLTWAYETVKLKQISAEGVSNIK